MESESGRTEKEHGLTPAPPKRATSLAAILVRGTFSSGGRGGGASFAMSGSTSSSDALTTGLYIATTGLAVYTTFRLLKVLKILPGAAPAGPPAPPFECVSHTGATIRLSEDYVKQGKQVLLFFYGRASTGG